MPGFTPTRRFVLLAAAAGTIVAAALIRISWMGAHAPPMFLAPMIGVIESCILPKPPAEGQTPEALLRSCSGPNGSAGALVDSTLSLLQPTSGRAPGPEIGYTLPVPLLKLFKPAGAGWTIDSEAVQRIARTIRDTDRPAIVYLFSNHFGVGAPIEEALQSDSRNLSVTPQGPLPRDKYYGSDIFNWSFASTDTDITRRRVEAVNAVTAELCKLEPHHRSRIRGITLLGELHHLFPGFEGGMGFGAPYLVSDYSNASQAGFRGYLAKNYGGIAQFNAAMGTHWTSFAQVDPPSKDVRSMPLRDFTEHIDSFAHGFLPIAGWTYIKTVPGQPRPVIRIYRNGEPIATATITQHRQDVLRAMPELGDVDTGWRYDMDFRSLPTGLHRIDVYLEEKPGSLIHLATRQVAIMDRQQSTPQPLAQKPLPPSREADSQVKAYLDLPLDRSSYFYNPLVPLWHAFRGEQVADYLEYFAKVVNATCLRDTQLYTHQIIPFSNPGWDANKYAIDASLQQLPGIRLGVSLYGEPTYGNSFIEWLRSTPHKAYGITEFHPLKAMSPGDFQAMLDRHAAHGASFISFFLEPRWQGQLVSREHNIFSFDPENREFGSSALYEDARAMSKHP
jgi:hypothetical protein